MCMLKGKEDFDLCVNKLDREKRETFADVLLSMEPEIRRLVARLIGEKLTGVSGTFSGIEEVKLCLSRYIKENGIENGKNHLMLLVYALFSDILKFPGNIVEKVQNLIVDEQCFDGALISILQKTIFNTQNQINSLQLFRIIKLKQNPFLCLPYHNICRKVLESGASCCS